MEEMKPWWLSKTIWSGLITSIIAILAAFGVIPPIPDSVTIEVITAMLGILTIVFRKQAVSKIAPLTS